MCPVLQLPTPDSLPLWCWCTLSLYWPVLVTKSLLKCISFFSVLTCLEVDCKVREKKWKEGLWRKERASIMLNVKDPAYYNLSQLQARPCKPTFVKISSKARTSISQMVLQGQGLSLYWTALHRTALYCTLLQGMEPHCTALNCTSLHCNVLYCNVRKNSALHFTVAHSSVLQ